MRGKKQPPTPFPLPTAASHVLQGTLMDGSGEAVVACDRMPEPCVFPSLCSRKKQLLWAQKAVDLAPHPVVAFVLLLGGVEKFFSGTFVSKTYIHFSKAASTVRVSLPRRKMETVIGLYSLNVLEELMVLLRGHIHLSTVVTGSHTQQGETILHEHSAAGNVSTSTSRDMAIRPHMSSPRIQCLNVNISRSGNQTTKCHHQGFNV